MSLNRLSIVSDKSIKLDEGDLYKQTLELIACAQSPPKEIENVRKYQTKLCSAAIKNLKQLSNANPPHTQACFMLATYYGNGSLGLSIDHEKAFQLYNMASKLNHPASTYRVGVCYEVGAGVKRDHARALLFYRKASALGDAAARYKLANILLTGQLGWL